MLNLLLFLNDFETVGLDTLNDNPTNKPAKTMHNSESINSSNLGLEMLP